MIDPLVHARAVVLGKHVLFVSNRRDPQLKRKLEKVFGCSLDWKEVEKMREIQAVCARILHGRYDMVFVQTSFISHKTDKLIKDACKATECRYVPVNKGRPNAVAASLADSP
jgi:hypothetical protein